jgi:hypothetical protein
MTALYRGILFVLTSKFYELILSLRSHIQSFKVETSDHNNYFDVGVLGFWNLMLEITMTIFAMLCLIIGVLLIALLAIWFYPLHAVIQYCALLLKNTRNPPVEAVPVLVEKIDHNNESPVIIKKEK